MRGSRILCAALMTLFWLAGTSRADQLPEWVKSAQQNYPQGYDKNVPFLVLLDERVTTVREIGRAETRSRYVVRVLSQEGRAAARREIQYDSQTKISDLHAWHVRADQKVFELENNRVIEESISDDLYSEIRSKVVRFGEVEIGSVVAFEWVQKEKPLVNQDYHFFQTRSPVVTSRYQLNLPPGWRVESFVFNYTPIKPDVSGNTYTWQLHGLPPIVEEAWMPESTAISPYVAVSYFPPRATSSPGTFSSWRDVSVWADQLMTRPAGDAAAIESKARELTAGLDSDLDKVRAISRWVQKSVRYVSIQLGVIGGYRPNLADVVLRRGYGDCKDKSALMRALLEKIGVKSNMVLVFSGDPSKVRPEFPSPLQFNHAVVAVEIQTDEASSLSHPQLGPLLYFDPTDNITPLGDLPFYLQGSYGLVVKGGAGALIRLPTGSESDNSVRREITVQVESSGDISAQVKESFAGQLACVARRRIDSASDFARELGSRVARDIAGAVVADLKISGGVDADSPLKIEYGVKASNYANRLGKLLVIRPVLLWVQDYPVFTKPEREYPVLFDMKSTKEDFISITLPEGLKLDELPANTAVKTSFGEFDLDYQVSGQRVIVRRSLKTTNRMVPVRQYAELKRFFDAARTASQASIVLVVQF